MNALPFNCQQVKAVCLILRLSAPPPAIGYGIYHFTVLLCIYCFQNTPDTHKRARTHTHISTPNSLPSCPILCMCNTSSTFLPPLFNILAQYRRVALGLHVQVGPLDCSPGLLGREVVEKKKKRQKGGDDGRKAHNNSLFPRMSGPAA